MGSWPRLFVIAALLSLPGDALLVAQPQELPIPQPEEVSPGQPEEVSPGQPEEVSPGQPEEVSPRQPEEVSPGQPEEVSPGQPEEVSPEQPGEPLPQGPERIEPATPKASPTPNALTPEQEEIERLRQQVADLQQRVDALTSSAQQDIEALQALRQEQAQVAERGQQIEENRLRRAALFADAREALHRADGVLLGGSFEIEEFIGTAYDLLGRATAEAAQLGNGEEAALGRSALAYVSMASDALEQDDLYGARIAVFSAAQQASQALTAAQGYSQPLYQPGP